MTTALEEATELWRQASQRLLEARKRYEMAFENGEEVARLEREVLEAQAAVEKAPRE